MQIEALYRAAIIALRNRQWEQATRNLLAVVNADPQHEDAARVLMDLERLRPVSYWRGAFMFAIERSEWAEAESAAARLQELEATQPDGSDLTTRLHELTTLDWYQPQPPAEPPSSADTTPPIPESDTETDPDDDPLPPGGGAPPNGSGDEAEDWPAPDSASADPGAGWQPPRDPLLTLNTWDNANSSSEDTGEITVPLALKAAEFSEGGDEIERDSPHGPIYDALSTPRALKTASFLDDLARDKPAAIRSLPPAKPGLARAPATLPPPTNEITTPPNGVPSPAEAAAPPPPAGNAPVHWSSRPRSRLTIAAFVALLIALLVIIARLARSSAPAIPANPLPGATPTEHVATTTNDSPVWIVHPNVARAPEHTPAPGRLYLPYSD